MKGQGNTAGKGIKFFEGSWQELLKAAGEQHKLIFVDMYTDWCAPCKTMEKVVFPDSLVGGKYNPLFLSYRLNAEKGEGQEIAKKFNVRGYPTYLYLNSKGDLIYRSGDYMEAARFNHLADQAVKSAADSNTLGKMEAAYKQGNREPAFLQAYITRLSGLDLDNTEVLDEYFKTMPDQDLRKEATLLFLGQHLSGTRTAILPFLMDNYARLSDHAKNMLQGHLFSQLLTRAFPIALQEKRYPEAEQLLAYAEKLDIQQPKQLNYLDRLELIYFSTVKNTAREKSTGYRLVNRVINIPDDSIRAEDARQYTAFITPFLNGQQDSTKFDGFSEDSKYMMHIYSNEIAATLYNVASVFATLPPNETAALQDAVKWAARSQQLDPSFKKYADSIITRLQQQAAGIAGDTQEQGG